VPSFTNIDQKQCFGVKQSADEQRAVKTIFFLCRFHHATPSPAHFVLYDYCLFVSTVVSLVTFTFCAVTTKHNNYRQSDKPFSLLANAKYK